jgi:hypothetical protein
MKTLEYTDMSKRKPNSWLDTWLILAWGMTAFIALCTALWLGKEAGIWL